MGPLSRERQLGLLANLPRVQAKERIQQGRYDPLDYQAVYRLYMQAYGDERIASKARVQSMEALIAERTGN